jgi:hypothetical protein
MKHINHREFEKRGIVLDGCKGIMEPQDLAMDYGMAMDAQSPLVTQTNAGIPAFLTTWIDPDIINVVMTPNKCAKIIGEGKKGDWTTQTAMFPLVEDTGEVASYGDFSENGVVGANANWVNRQSYMFQTVTSWGEMMLARMAEARIAWAQQLNLASVKLLDKFQNQSYFFGVAGLLNYGLLNDPSLSAPITPATKVAGGTTWAAATAAEIYTDIVSLYGQLVSQTLGVFDREVKMVLAMTPEVEVNLTKTNQYNVNVTDQIKKNFPNLRIETAVQYAVTGGNLVQMIAEDLDGQDTGSCAFNEKLRAHPVVVGISNFKQKKTSGTWGCIIKQPLCIAGMLGV